ncbi:MAG: PKD domain-containing protein [Bacteroidota bacterium]
MGILFDVEQPLFLKSVKVFAEGRGARFIKILDAEENVVLSKIANLDDGENIVQLDKALNIGSDYTIILSSPSKPLRIGTSASFPYEIPGTIKLNRSTGSFLKYYYFFDWEIQTLHACGRTPITLSVNNTSDAPNVGIAVSAEQVAEDAATVEFNSISDSDLNAHWSFGDSNESTDRNPVHTYSQAGEYVVTHTVTDGMGCTNAVQKTILVEEDTETTSVQDITDENAVTIFPNPATEQVILQTRRTTPIQVRVTDFLGKSIAVPVSRLNSTGLRLNTTNLPDGVYYIIIDLNGKQLSKKLIKLN